MITHQKMGMNAHRVHIGKNSYMLFSFDTLVAFKENNVLYEDEYNYSRTTNKHISQYAQGYTDIVTLSQDSLVNRVCTFMALETIENFDEVLL